jgi:hypothetical protein
MENVIAAKEVQVERKHLSIEFRENERGRFLRITETAHGHRNAVIIPSTGLADFTSALAPCSTWQTSTSICSATPKADGNGSMKPLLGGKGANAGGNDPHRPAGASRVHHHHRSLHLLLRQQADLPGRTQGQIEAGVRNMEKIMGTKFRRHHAMPLLVAVRSGARDSMPGMMDTILNLGLNDQTVLALARPPATSGSPGIATAASSRCTATSSWACRRPA